MEKVKLTPEQAAFVEEWKSIKTGFENLVRALTEDYEIESEKPKFLPGDKVVYKEGGLFINGNGFAVIRAHDRENNVVEFDESFNHPMKFLDGNRIRLATPEEIYWLETLGRDKVGDFRVGDVYNVDDRNIKIFDSNTISKAKNWYEDGLFTGIYLAESFKPFPKEEQQ